MVNDAGCWNTSKMISISQESPETPAGQQDEHTNLQATQLQSAEADIATTGSSCCQPSIRHSTHQPRLQPACSPDFRLTSLLASSP
ncbi:hypothetical protein HaLaN_11449, partial [Haematococcus lacustris]